MSPAVPAQGMVAERLAWLRERHPGWEITTVLTGWDQRRMWRARRDPADPEAVAEAAAATAADLDAALTHYSGLDPLRRVHGATWEVGSHLPAVGVPAWCWARRRTRLGGRWPGVHDVVEAPTPARLAAVLRQQRERELRVRGVLGR